MRHAWVRELSGWAAASLLAIIAVAQIASTERSELLFRDGDSLVVALLVRSLADGEPFDWTMSSVLFVPEAVVFAVLWMLGNLLSLDVTVVLAINAVVNLVALYGAVRLAAGRRRGGHAPVAWSVIALASFCLVAVTETTSARESLELASLLTTTTYYSATVIAVVLSVGIVRRAFDRPAPARKLAAWLAVVAGISVLTNPMYAVWAAVPLGVVLGVSAVYVASRQRALHLLGWLFAGTAIGFLARIPFSEFIAEDGSAYIQPALWPESARYYAGLLAERLSSPFGVMGTLILAALLVIALVQTFRAADAGARVVAASAWLLPLLVTIGAVAVGTHAARYLEPVAFAPILGLVASSRVARVSRRSVTAITAAVSTVLVVGAGLSAVRVGAVAQHPNADLRCVDEWVSASGQTGAGQFWTVRLPKLHLTDSSQLVQVDHQLTADSWLTNSADFTVGEVTFLIEDAQSVPWELGTNALPTSVIACGQYTIYDFSPLALPLDPPRS